MLKACLRPTLGAFELWQIRIVGIMEGSAGKLKRNVSINNSGATVPK